MDEPEVLSEDARTVDGLDGWTIIERVEKAPDSPPPEVNEPGQPGYGLPAPTTVSTIIVTADVGGETVELRFSPTHTDEELRFAIKGGLPEYVVTPDGRRIAATLPVVGYENELRLIAERPEVAADLDVIYPTVEGPKS